ncbi:hypothetical protein ACIGZI_00865 [Streptomyces griseus]|uniref:hypothetical protein n=1 Tax=Streptomyces griseus TaxID=1911 RepID=UPI0037D4DF02
MKATINDIRRGDRFTWSGRTWIAAADAHPNLWGIHGAVDVATLPGGMEADKDGVVRQTSQSQLKLRAVHYAAPIVITQRDVQISLTHEDLPVLRRKRSALESSLRLVKRKGDERKALGEQMDEADQEFGDLIRMSLANGAKVAQLVESTGLSRARIYQIRDGRR